MLTRRILLASASAALACTQLPALASAAPQDEALAYIAKRIHEGLLASAQDQDCLFYHAFGFVTPELKARWLDETRVVGSTDSALRRAFKFLKTLPTHYPEYPVPAVYRNGSLTPYGQLVADWLPIAPSNYGHRDFFDRMDILAPQYL